jgi:phage terminase large subunit
VTHRAPYALGADSAGTGEDYFAAKVICNLDGATAATMHVQHMDEDLFAEQLFCLGTYYGEALLGVEVNYSSHPTRELAVRLRYPNLYMREILSTVGEKVVREYGFETTPRTRRVILAELVALMRENVALEVHEGTLLEMMTFVKKKNGRQEAQEGCHDDLVMSLAIAHFISHSAPTAWQEVKLPAYNFIANNFSTARAEKKYFERGF